MTNIVQSIGYSLGKLHTGFFAYLCDIYREGEREPLEAVLETLGVPVPAIPTPAREWNSIDLAILDGQERRPRILIEMKVDDHEHETTRVINGVRKKGYQTDLYAEAFPECDAYLYVTLGLGEYFHAPYGHRFRWVRLRDFLGALDRIAAPNHFVEQWRDALRNELDIRERVFHLDRSRLWECRAGAWNIYFLGRLKEELLQSLGHNSLDIDPTCYTYGTRPDTILNFGWSREPEYMEINNNGRLNLKLSFDNRADAATREGAVREAMRKVVQSYASGSYRLHETGRVGASKTVASFDIGLVDEQECLRFAGTKEDSVRKVETILRVFYGRHGNNSLHIGGGGVRV